MSEQVLKAGETARNRRFLQRNENRRHLESESAAEKSSWLTVVLQTPTKSLTVLESFFQTSGFLYLTLGFLCLLIPKEIGYIFSIESTPQTTGFCRLGGVYFVGVGVFYVTSARSSPLVVPANRVILGTVFERIVLVNFYCLAIYVLHNGPRVFILSVMAMDTVLAGITYYLWAKETKVQLLVAIPWSCKKILQLLSPENLTWVSKSSAVVKLIGYAQVVIGTTLLLRPDIAQNALQLEPFDGPSTKSIMAFVMMCIAVIGWLHVMGGAADALLFNAVAVFYRVFFSVPVVFCLAMLNCIPGSLALFLAGFDAFAACSVCIFLSCCKTTKSQ